MYSPNFFGYILLKVLTDEEALDMADVNGRLCCGFNSDLRQHIKKINFQVGWYIYLRITT